MMSALDCFLRMRDGIVAMLIVIAVTMYLLPPAYLMVQNTRTGIPVADLVWATAREFFNMFYWFPMAGAAATGASIFYRLHKFSVRVLVGSCTAIVWLFGTAQLMAII